MILTEKYKVGDHLVHSSGSIWRVAEVFSHSLQVSHGASDLVALSEEELSSYSGQIPRAVMNWWLIK